ncbi:DUF2599 domain-containing protein [Mycobacterium kiyosense]|uniref:DUF2599 domain-containing protein n=1 Tax=Mycobacterium kiyosense TaxID=2871094 RepID=A0A9P3Q6R4_9MYCO|nr:DUF2599 domain-containing protein [Mycobacterium kiyosense]BDB40359.1 hypothetical protein IWGMT90018_08050 [Mycobacterium kiyosense]GLB85930.1 hypothetical protein SRL2020028_51860 [Mycobacterium kiyosense]GLB88666.1 hypothetical protein SRL2020130_14830 [Mycobacterium kiyosense]GLB95064.1 hypothetical protein SRL2020226_18400 [Mycobacterium kiyosense]GLC01833.1 hypothetical protein SRL2020400_24240 [Mycobacterium kiyosense]
MKLLLCAPVAALVALLGAAPAPADPGTADTVGVSRQPPFVDHTEWVYWGRLPSLRVYPTPAARAVSRDTGTQGAAEEAWAEVLARSPDAHTPGMWEQFLCHWRFAEFARPGKTSWNLEPWRPVVDDAQMIAASCNPGGPEETF